MVTFHYEGRTLWSQSWSQSRDVATVKTSCSSSWCVCVFAVCFHSVCVHLNLMETSSTEAPWTNRARGQDTQECLKLFWPLPFASNENLPYFSSSFWKILENFGKFWKILTAICIKWKPFLRFYFHLWKIPLRAFSLSIQHIYASVELAFF